MVQRLRSAAALVVAVFSVLACPATARAPQVVEGRLENGVSYRIVRQAEPAGALSLRLGFKVGSFDEADDERGFAHFVEHMAFNGTRSIREDAIETTFAKRGVAFGRDLNAATTALYTVFELDLPSADRRSVDLAYGWLSDVATGLQLDPAAVEREKGVVLAELEASYGPARRVSERTAAFYGPEHRAINRLPIGTRSSIKGATAERLRSFYARWYRPETAIVVVAGDLDLAATEARVRATFGRWRPQGPAGVRASSVAFGGARRLDAVSIPERGAFNALSACRMQTEPEADLDVRMRETVLDGLWAEILNRRFDLLEEDGATGLVEASVKSEGTQRTGRATCLLVSPAGDRWAPALAAAQAEIVRFLRDGPTEEETEAAVERFRSRLRGALPAEARTPAAELAKAHVLTALDDVPYPSAAERMRLFTRAVAGLDPVALKERFARRWNSGDGPLVTFAGATTPTREALLQAWREGEAASPPPFVPPAEPRWAYQSFGPDGVVTSREAVKKGDFVRLRFANGLVVNYKRSAWNPEVVDLAVVFGRGREGLGRDDLFVAEFGVGSFGDGGVGKHGKTELNRLFAGHDADAELTLTPWYFSLTGDVNASSLHEQLALWAAYLSDPGFRPSIDNAAPTYLDFWRQWTRSDPAAAAQTAMARAVIADDPRLPPSDGAYVRSADIRRVLEPIVRNAPLELSVVGDVSEEDLIAAVKTTLGALPARTQDAGRRSDAWFLRIPASASRAEAAVEHEGAPDQAAVLMAWPLFVAEPARRREEYALHLLGMVIEAELRAVVREKLGASYAPTVWVESPDAADQGVLFVQIATRPADADAVVAATREIVARLASKGVTQTGLDAVRTPMLARRDDDESTNAFWLSALTGSSRDEGGLDESLQFRALMSGLRPADLQKAARVWLAAAPFMAVARPSAAVLAGSEETPR